jgi:chemotaxis protein MotB
MADGDLGPYAKTRGTRWGRVFAGLFFVAVGTFVAAYYLPLYRSHQRLADQYRELGQRSHGLSESVSRVQAELKQTSLARDQLQAEHDLRERAKTSTGEQQERAKVALSSKLDKYLKKGNAEILVSGGSLFVAFDSALLFLPQKLDVSPIGRALLCDVAKASEAKALTVRASLAAGSVVPPPLAMSYPSSWALSAGRAAAVAQTLEQGCSFPAAQLSAIGNGYQQPRAGRGLTGEPVELEVGLSTR